MAAQRARPRGRAAPRVLSLLLAAAAVAAAAVAAAAAAAPAAPGATEPSCGSLEGLAALAAERYRTQLPARPAGAAATAAATVAAAARSLIIGHPLLTMVVARARMWGYVPRWNEWFRQAAPLRAGADAALGIGATNPDSLYAVNWLDLAETGPVVVSWGDNRGRFFVLSAIDAWARTFATLGCVCGSSGGGGGGGGSYSCPAMVPASEWLLLPPGFPQARLAPDARRRFAGRVLEAPTAAVLLLGRTYAAQGNESDLAATRALQDAFGAAPLLAPRGQRPDGAGGTGGPGPADRLFSEAAKRLLKYGAAGANASAYAAAGLLAAVAGAARALPQGPPARGAGGGADAALRKLLAAAGLRPGRGFDQRLGAGSQRELLAGLGAALGMGCVDAEAAKGELGVPLRDGWSVSDYSSLAAEDPLRRAAAAKVLLTALPSSVQLYFSSWADAGGGALSGAGGARYSLSFPPPGPPAAYYWGLVMYDASTLALVPNVINRTSVTAATLGLAFGGGGGGGRGGGGGGGGGAWLTIYVSADPPAGADERANWLPAPPGPFVLALRLVGPPAPAPGGAAGGYAPPPVVRLP